MFPEVFWGYCLYLKSHDLVSHEATPSLMVVAEWPKNFEFNTSSLMEKAL